MARKLPKYPIYVISKGRHDVCHTANFLEKDKVPYHLVVEPQEADLYINKYGKDKVYILPFSNLGQGSIPARNWVWEHSKTIGAEKHWILDDNIRGCYRYYQGKRIYCNSNAAFKCCEEFTDRYENIALSGLNYSTFVVGAGKKPFYHNVHVYSFILIRNDLKQRWRGRYNEDTDLCLQVLSDNWCTILLNAYCCQKIATMTMKGGNSDQLYKGDGRLKMANSLKRMWPKVVDVTRRFQRPQHKIVFEWRRFDTPLIKKKNLKIKNKKNNVGQKLVAVGKVKSKMLKGMIKENE